MARLHGKGGLVLVGPTQGAAASPVAYLSHWDISWTPDQLAVTARGDATTTWISGIEGASGTFAGFFDDASAQLYRLARDGLPRNFYLYPQAAAHDKYFGGLIVLTGFAVSGAVADAIAISASWAAAAEVSEYVTAFIINATASIHGSGSVAVLPPGTTLISGQSTIACTPIISATAAIAGAGQCGAIPRAAYLNGVGVTSLVTPILALSPSLAGQGTVKVTPIISGTAQVSGQGVISIPGKLTGALAGTGAAGGATADFGAPVIIGARALVAGAGVAGSGFSQAIQAKTSTAGVGSPGAVPIHSCTASVAGAGSTGGSTTAGSTTLTVTATQGGSTANGMLLSVKVVTGAAAAGSQTGASAHAAVAQQAAITTTATGSQVYGAGEGSGTSTQVPNGSTTNIVTVADSTHAASYTAFKATSLTGTPGSITIGDTNTGGFGCALFEILPAAGLTEDSSAPAAASTTTATTVATASFTAPSGSLLVALISSDGGASQTTMTVSGGSLSWSEKSKDNGSPGSGNDYKGVWIAQVP